MDRRMTAIWFLLFCLYFSSSRFSLDGYELEYVLSAMNVYHGNGPSLARGFTGCPGIWPTDGDLPVYPRQNLLQTYLSVPFYAAGALLFGEAPTRTDGEAYWKLPWGPVVTVSLLNPMLAAFLAILVAWVAKETGLPAPYHYVLAVLYGITSMNWHYGTLGMEVLQTAVVLSATGCAIKYNRSGKNKWLLLATLTLLLIPNCKKMTVIFLVPIIGYLLWSLDQRYHRLTRSAIVLISLASGAGILVMAGSMLGRFHADPNLFPHLLKVYLSGGHPAIDLLFGLTLSPGEGILIFNPLILFALAAWPEFHRSYRSESFLFISITAVLSCTLLFIPYVLIDEEWGPRYLFLLLPLIYISGSRGLLAVRSGARRNFFILLLIISILLQWLSSMFLGYMILNFPLAMGVSDYSICVYKPSVSQIWLAATCFISHLNSLVTGDSLIITYREYARYTGLGGESRVLIGDLSGFDYPSGGFFIVRWVLAEKGIMVVSPLITLILKICVDGFILGMLAVIVRNCLKTRPATGLISAPV